MTSSTDIAQLDSLVSRIVDGVQTPADERALADLLARDDEARRRYRRLMAVHTALHSAYASVAAQSGLEQSGLAQSASAPARPSHGTTPSMGRVAAAAVLVAGLGLAATVGMVGFGRRPAPAAAAVPAVAAVDRPLAVVTQTRFLNASTTGEPLVIGRPLAGSDLQIAGGAVALTLRNGVELLLEGPADFELLSELRAVLRAGTIVVKMPKGSNGFRVETATTDVLDLGTEFAVKVGVGAQTDVQVYDGAVLAASKPQGANGRFPRRLEAGEAARFSSDRKGEAIDLPYEEERFIRRLPKDRGIEHAALVAAEQELVWQFGRPEHEAIIVSRPRGSVRIDGHLDEWADAPGFIAWLGGDRSAAESVDGRMMYDADRLYIAARVADPVPLASRINPAIDPDDGWRGGAIQVRLSTDRRLGWPIDANAANYYRMRGIQPSDADKEAATNPQLAHLTMWYHAPSQNPCLTIQKGMLTGELLVNPGGFEGAFAPAADGRGYVLEYAIPWRLLDCEHNPPQPGDTLGVNWQVHFSDEGGRLWRTQILDVRNPSELRRIYTWERAATWGRAEYR
jgi:hypothetical protein